MPNRDYAVRPKKAKSVNKLLIFIIILLLLAMGALALWALKTQAPVQHPQTITQPTPKNTLPSPPEEIYSYIRDLENREVPVDKNAKQAKLTKEQEQLLQRQKEEEKRKKALLEQQQAQLNQPTTPPQTVEPSRANETVQNDKPKAEVKKPVENSKKEPDLPAKNDVDKAKTEKPVETPKTATKFGLQCGAFKNKAQAENMQARLVMAGFNARINSSGEWNRVVVGPIGERAVAVRSQANARSVAECLVVAM